MTLEITGILVENGDALTLAELANALRLDPTRIVEMVEHRLVEPQGHNPQDWRFNSICFRRIQIAVRLQHDLDVNLHGAALALDLLDHINELEARLDLLEKLADHEVAS